MADVFAAGGTSSLDNVLYKNEVTILGIGNIILRDEGFGVRVAEYLDKHYEFPDTVQIVDGGTLGIELTQYVTGTENSWSLTPSMAGPSRARRSASIMMM